MSPVKKEIVEEVTPPSQSNSTDTLILGRLLRIADSYRRSGAPNQAIEMYLELIERNSETPEGRKAHKNLMEICEGYEREGKMRQARALYERLL